MISPIHYSLTIRTTFPTSFTGVAEIETHLGEATTSIELNTATPLQLLNAVAVLASGERVPVASTVSNKISEITTFHFEKTLPAGEITLVCKWQGRLDDGTLQGMKFLQRPPTSDMKSGAYLTPSSGYYRIPCSSEEGIQEYYTATQFQPTAARRAFPCFDHPAKKATFSLSLIFPSRFCALSNTAISSQEATSGKFPHSPGLTEEFIRGSEGFINEEKREGEQKQADWQIATFHRTVKMPTYLLAWAIGKFSSAKSSYTSPITQNVIPLTVYASTSLGHIEKGQGNLSLDTLARVMPLYEKIFGVAYPLDKLDILVCDAFDAGAMENFGLIMGRTSTLLHDAATSGVAGMFGVVVTTGHEAAHMWFGNTCTMAWWDSLWLNEGFATLMGEVIVLDKLEPNWKVNSAFIKFHRTTALALDSLRSSHPVQMPYTNNEKKVIQAFDAISYKKGSCVLRMLCSLVGEEAFLSAVSTYIKSHLYGTVSAEDLWNAMPEVCGIPAKDFMEPWISKVGFPIVTVKETTDGILLRQNRYLTSGDPTLEEDSTIWPIPLKIHVVGRDDLDKVIIMRSRELLVKMSEEAVKEVYTVNAGTTGLFRVSYPPMTLNRIAAEAGKKDTRLLLPDRLGMLQDVIHLAEAGYISTTSSLDFMRQLPAEPEYLVWTEIALAIQRLLDVWWEQPDPVLAGIRALTRSIFGPIMEKLGFVHKPDDDTDARLFRMLVFAASASAEVPSVIEYIKKAYVLLVSGQGDANSGDLNSIIVMEAVKHGGVAEYNMALAIYENPPTPQHQLAAISGLTSTRIPELVQRTMMMLSSGQVKEQNMPHFFMGLTSNPASRRLVWDFFKAGWSVIEVQFRGSYSLGHLVQGSFQSLTSTEDAKQVRDFFADKDCSSFNQALEQGLEKVETNAKWLARDSKPVSEWLEKEGYM